MNLENISFLLLTEDSGQDAWVALKTLLLKALYLFGAPNRLTTLSWQPAEEKAQKAMPGNGWKSDNPNDDWKRRELARAIATHLARTDGERFVFVHLDGDDKWSESRGGTRSENVEQFNRKVRGIIEAYLAQRKRPEKIQQLLMVVPYYCIEAWLYQNIDEALRILSEEHKDKGRDARRFREWAEDRTRFDDVLKIKDVVSFRDKYNLRLAEKGWPARRVYEVGTSFHHAVETLKASQPLMAALEGECQQALTGPPTSQP